MPEKQEGDWPEEMRCGGKPGAPNIVGYALSDDPTVLDENLVCNGCPDCRPQADRRWTICTRCMPLTANDEGCCSCDLRGEEKKHVEVVQVEQSVQRLREALKPVAEIAAELEAKGYFDDCWDEEMTFPNDVELSVADLKRAAAALKEVQSS